MEKTKRKVLKLGDLLAVSIPKSYADYYNIKPKDNVEVITSDDGIFIKLLNQSGLGDA